MQRITLYVGGITVAAVGLLAMLDWGALSVPERHVPGLIALVGLNALGVAAVVADDS